MRLLLVLTLYIPGYFYTLFVSGGGGGFSPLSKKPIDKW